MSLKLLLNQVRFKSTLNELLRRMPTEKLERKILKASRQFKMTTATKYPAGIVNLHVLGTGLTPSLYLFTDQTRYLFNCGEGTQRLAHEHKTKLAKLEHVFVTNNSWDMIGGLPGVSLTIQDIGIPRLTLHGPGGLENLFQATRRFVILKDLQISVVNASTKSHYEDHVLRVDYVPILSEEVVEQVSSSSSSEEDDTTDYYERYRKMKGQNMVEVVSEEQGKYTNSSLCYICQLKKKEGALLIDKCIARGVPPGPLLGKLKAGEDIELASGEVVKAQDVRTPDCPGPVFIVIDCPTISHLPNLIENQKLAEYQKEPHLVVHFTKSSVMLDPRYKKWMEDFHVSTTHLVINDLSRGVGSEAVHKVQIKLNLIDSQVFPQLQEEIDAKEDRLNIKVQLILGETMLRVSLRPEVNAVDSTSVVAVNPTSYIEETAENTQFQSELADYKKLQLNSKEKFPNILFLGTGSSIPNKTRNVSSFLLNISESKSIMFDCGEGTLTQLRRFYGKENMKSVLNNLKAIYISHLHADHHLGLVSLLKAKNKKVYLIAPRQIQSWLHLYSKRFEKIIHLFELIPCFDFIENKTNHEDLLNSLDCSEILTDYVKHCPNAFGISIKLKKNNYKLTYSGDTMPCDSLIKIGLDSDLLVHEATMEDELKDEAVIKMHSTTTQAIEVGRKMKAKFTILTHFSQRYAKVPVLDKDKFNKVGIAFDNMNIACEDVDQLEQMIPVLGALFQEECDEMEQRTAKRKRKKEFTSLLVANSSNQVTARN